MMKINKKVFNVISTILVVTVLVLIIINLVGMIAVKTPTEQYTASQVKAKLSAADEIIIRKQLSINQKFVVFADDIPVATIEGKVLPVFGDTLCLSAPNGDVLGVAQQEVLHLTAQAVCDVGNEHFIFKKSLIPLMGTDLKKDGTESKYTWGFFTQYITEGNAKAYKTVSSPFIKKITITKEHTSSFSPESAILIAAFDETTIKSSSNSSSSSNKN